MNPAETCVAAAERRLRDVRERLFPPTWVKALRRLKDASQNVAAFSPKPDDLLHELLVPTPNTMHGDDPDEDFRVWFFYRHEFGKLLCLYDAMSRVVEHLTLTEPGEPEFTAIFEVAARLLDAKSDRDIALVCLDVASKQSGN